MNETGWEEALETVVGFLGDPPAPNTPQGKVFDEALVRVLAAAPSAEREPLSSTDAAAGLDDGLRARLDALARRRAESGPFGDHPDGIGPTLGMDLSRS